MKELVSTTDVVVTHGNPEILRMDPVTVEFETRRWLSYLSMPLILALTIWVMAKKCFLRIKPKVNCLWFDGLGPSCLQIKEGEGSWKALDVTYNVSKEKNIGGLIDRYWLSMMNPQATRNRLRLAKHEIKAAVLGFGDQKEVRILSLAAGSAQSVIEVTADLALEGVRVKVLLVDNDQTALDYATRLSFRYGVAKCIETRKASVVQVRRISRDFRPNIIEMLGFLDYCSHDQAVRLVGKIRESLGAGGVFLTCNIRSNPEKHFLHWVANWRKMVYRSRLDLIDVIVKSGFEDYRLMYEPLRIHGLAICYCP